MDFVDFSDVIAEKLGVKFDKGYLIERANGDEKEFFGSFVPWMDVVHKKYGDRIILIDCNYSPVVLGDDDRLYNCDDLAKAKKFNDFFRKHLNM